MTEKLFTGTLRINQSINKSTITSNYMYKRTTADIEGNVVHVKLVKAPSNSLLTVPRRPFCRGSLLPVFSVRCSVTFHLKCVHILFKFSFGR